MADETKPTVTTEAGDVDKLEQLRLLEKCIEDSTEAIYSDIISVGFALKAIKIDKLYKLSHTTWGAYCRERWTWSPQWCNRRIKAAEAAQAESALSPSERQKSIRMLLAGGSRKVQEPNAEAESDPWIDGAEDDSWLGDGGVGSGESSGVDWRRQVAKWDDIPGAMAQAQSLAEQIQALVLSDGVAPTPDEALVTLETAGVVEERMADIQMMMIGFCDERVIATAAATLDGSIALSFDDLDAQAMP